jgi:hypothetical protein|tara:strand:+ start:205 stop:1893 length:1689 start_codon:yes stop_codon:yes gene_type:complete
MGKIISKTEGAGDSASTEPATLTKGELAVNTQGGLLFHGDSSGATARFKATTLAGTNYSLFTVSGGNVTEIGPGTDGYVLTATGTGSIPAWEAAAGGGVSLGSSSSTAHRGDHGVSAYNSGATRYTHPTSAGNKHVPTGGSSGQFLKYSASGTAVWAADNNDNTVPTLSNVNALDITEVGTISSGVWSGTALVAGKVPAHDSLTGFVANEHLDWTSSVGTIHSNNYTNTTYSVGAGGLTQQNFTTTLKNKLDAIEASADVTDTANVTSAGALMDSECTDLAAVKATEDPFTAALLSKLNAIEASATADQTDAQIKAAVEAASDSNTFTDADHSKLNGIAASANNYSHSTNANLTGPVTSSGNATTMAANSIDSAQYVDGSIDTAHYADDSITSVKIKEHAFICTAGISNVGTSSSERHFSFTSTSGNTGTFLGNHAFVVPYECKLIKAFAVFDEVISDGSNMTTFRIQKASQDSTSYSDHYKFTELLMDPHTGMTSFTNTGAGSAFDLLGDMGHTINTGSIGEQSFLEGDKLLAGITVNSGAASGGTRGSVTWVFKSTGGIT